MSSQNNLQKRVRNEEIQAFPWICWTCIDCLMVVLALFWIHLCTGNPQLQYPHWTCEMVDHCRGWRHGHIEKFPAKRKKRVPVCQWTNDYITWHYDDGGWEDMWDVTCALRSLHWGSHVWICLFCLSRRSSSCQTALCSVTSEILNRTEVLSFSAVEETSKFVFVPKVC